MRTALLAKNYSRTPIKVVGSCMLTNVKLCSISCWQSLPSLLSELRMSVCLPR